jgi:FkbM family methyltransferase
VKAYGSVIPDRATGGMNSPGSHWGPTAPPTLPGIELKFGRSRLRVRSDETFVFYATYIAGEYQPLDIREGDVVVDAGANIGDFTIEAAHRAGPQGCVIAIEPNPLLWPYLEWNVNQNGLTNVKIVKCALGIPGNYVLIQKADGGTVGGTIAPHGSGAPVRVKGLDEILFDLGYTHVDVVKMDIEGGELAALSGFAGLPEARCVAVELHGKLNLAEVPSLLSRHFDIWYEKPYDIWKNSIVNIVSHPLDFFASEIRSRFIAVRGFLMTVLGREAVVPSVGRSDFAIVYGRRRASGTH